MHSEGPEAYFSADTTLQLGVSHGFDEPLVPLSNETWPTFNTVEAFTYRPDLVQPETTYEIPRDTSLASSVDGQTPFTENITSTSTSKSRSATHSQDGKRIPRPRNAFMIYRSSVWSQQKIPTGIERDHRHISRIIGHCWNNLPEEEKRIWHERAAAEKAEHTRKYPGYRFSPALRTDKPAKRKVKRNGEKDMDRCKVLADLLLAGKEGRELEIAINQIDSHDAKGLQDRPQSSNIVYDWQGVSKKREESDFAPFESPLLPPSDSPGLANLKFQPIPHLSNEPAGTPDVEPHLLPSSFQPGYQGYFQTQGSTSNLLSPPYFQDASQFSGPQSFHTISSYLDNACYQSYMDSK